MINKLHIAILASTAIAFASCGRKSTSTSVENSTPNQNLDTPPENSLHSPEFPETPNPADPKNLPRDTVENLGMKMDFSDPETIVEQLAKILSNTTNPEDIDKIADLIGKGTFTDAQLTDLKLRIAQKRLQLDPIHPFKQIGQIKPGKHNRYAIQFSDKSQLFLDLKMQNDGKWKIENVQLPKTSADQTIPNVKTDPLNYTHAFLNHLLNQRFEQARAMVDTTAINDAKLAGLCIIFEEAKYKLDPKKPLRAIILKDTTAAFYTNVVSTNDDSKAQFSIIAKRQNPKSPWLIHEINLDQLLGDYATRVADGDVYYTPLIKNPEGGDKLVIYFEFDSQGLTPRTAKQLDIVISLLKIDPNKKITISGHTDSKGTDAYNQNLSAQRATAVKTYLAEHGVPATQILTEAYGQSKPRFPNQAEDGTDDPTGRRANRRTEIYLDF